MVNAIVHTGVTPIHETRELMKFFGSPKTFLTMAMVSQIVS
jgi:hypothetical protein